MSLSVKNCHVRDGNISLTLKPVRKYNIKTDSKSYYTSVTTWCGNLFPKFDSTLVIENMMKGKNWNPENKYWGMTPDEIKKLWSNAGTVSSEAGTTLHNMIESYMNGEKISSDEATWYMFLEFDQDIKDMEPYRTEWMVND